MSRTKFILPVCAAFVAFTFQPAMAKPVTIKPYGENQERYDQQHRDLVRSVQWSCARANDRPFSDCVRSGADRAVRQSDDRDLQRFHRSLPQSQRYTTRRANVPTIEFDLDLKK